MTPPEQVRAVTEEVLARTEYQPLRPGAAQRLVDLVRDAVARLLAFLVEVGGGGVAGVVAVVVVGAVVGLLLVALVRLLRARAPVAALAAGDAALGRDELLARAEAARSDGDLTAAVRSRYAVVVRDLEARGVLDGHPGTTVGEVDAAVAEGVPDARDLVVAAGAVLAAVVYGDRPATAADDDAVAAAVAAVAPRSVAVDA